MGMTKTEARELKPVVNRKFNALTEELDIRYREIRSDLSKRAKKEYEKTRQAYIERLESVFGDSFNQTVRELRGVIQDAENEGIEISTWGLPISFDYVERFSAPDRVSVDVSKVTGKLQEDLHNNYIRAKQQVHRQRDSLLDNLTLRTVETDSAKEFLTNLPNVDSFLPALSEEQTVALLNQ